MRIAIIFILAVLSFTARAQEVLKQGGEKTFGATTGQVLKWDGTKWVPDTDLTGTADAYGVLDSTAFRAFNVATAPKYIILTDSLRGGKFRRCYTCTADQYMVFTDALGRKWERFDTDGRYNAKWFGAKGNGSSDDRWFLQNLADYINSKGGGTLYMPKGVYNVSKKTSTGTGLSLWNNTTLEGDGWQTVFNYTETFVSASSAAIGSRSGNADRSQVQQDSGNVNISIRNLKINFTTKVNRRGNGIGLGGTVGGKIHNVWVNGSGGYSIHIVKNNDTALAEGKRSENIGISNCLITDFGDTGIEFSGTNNCTASDCEISGPGLVSDIGSAVIVWNGSTNTTISNITIKATANAVSSGIAGVWIQPSYNPLSTPNYKQTSKTVLSNIVAENCHYGLIIGTDEAGPIWGKSKNTIISNCVFTGNPLYGIGVQVNNADTILISNTKFSDFSRNIDVSSTQTFSNQRNVSNLSIKDCIFWGGLTPGFNAITGVNDLDFSGNTIENTPSTGITFRGIRGATVNDNIFKNIGTSGNVSATVFTTGNGTNTRETKHITANNNRLVDDRATKTTFFCIQLAGATDSCLVMGNDARGGKSGAIAYTNAGTGTSIKFKDTYTGEPYNSDINSDAIANAVLTTNGSGVGLWLLRTSLFTASNGLRAVGSDFQLGSSSTAVGPGDYTGNIFHNLRGFNSTWNTSVGTGLFINGSTADIGVRISNPLASFHIGGGGNFRMNDGFKFSTDGGNNAELSSPSSLYLYAGIPIGSAPSGTAELNITDNLVGIRTNSPSQHLHVNGNLRVTGQFYDSSNAPGGAGQVLTSGGSTTAWATLAPADAAGVIDSTAFRAFNATPEPKYVIMTDSLRGGKFRRNYTGTADQYMIFTDAIGRKWERFDYPAIKVQWFGASPAKANNSYEIKTCLNYATGKNYDVLFTQMFNLTSSVIVPSNIKIRGDGGVTATTTGFSCFTMNNVQDVSIKGISIIGSGTYTSGAAVSTDNGITMSRVKNVSVEGCTIKRNRNSGIALEGTESVRIENCLFVANAEGRVNSSAADIFDYTSNTGGIRTHNIVLHNNKLYSNSDIGIALGLNGGLISATVTSNVAKPFSESMVPTSDGTNVRKTSYLLGYTSPATDSVRIVVSQNYSYNTLSAGFYVSYIQNLLMSDCHVKRAGVNGGTSSGIIAGFRFTNVGGTVTGCTVEEFLGANQLNQGAFGISGGGEETIPIRNAQDSLDINLSFVNCVVKGSTGPAVSMTGPKLYNTQFSNCSFSDFEDLAVYISNESANNRHLNKNIRFEQCNFYFTKPVARGVKIYSVYKGKYEFVGCSFISTERKVEQYGIFYNDQASTIQDRASEFVLKGCYFKNLARAVGFYSYLGRHETYQYQIYENRFDTVKVAYKFFTPAFEDIIPVGFMDNYHVVDSILDSNTAHSVFVLGKIDGYQIYARTDGVWLTGVPTYGQWWAGDQIWNSDNASNIEKWLCTVSGNPGTFVPVFRLPSTATTGNVLSWNGTAWVQASDKNGYYGGNSGNGGDGTVPNGTTSTLANDFTLAGTDNVGGVPAFRVTTGGSAADKGLQTWRPSTGTDSLLLHTDAGAYKLDAKGKSLDISSPVGTSISTTSASITLAHTTGTIGVNAADRTDFTGTDLTFSTSSVGSTTAIMQPLVITAANVTVSSSQSEIICLGQSGDINLTFNYTPFSIIGGTHRIKITNSSPFKVILIRGGSWDWRDSYGVASVTNKTVYSGQTVDLIWGDGAGTDYWLIKTSESFTTGIQEETSTTVNYDGRSNMLYIPTSATTTTINLPEIVASGPTVSQVTVGAKFKIAIDREANVTIARGGASDLIKAHNYSTTGQTSVVTTGGTFFTQTFTAVGANLWIVN